MADKDTQLDLKKRARRRLVGAVTLATAAVILLPVVMEQEPKPVGQDIQIRIPSQTAEPSKPAIPPAKEAPAVTSGSASPAKSASPQPSPPDQGKTSDDAKAAEAKPEPPAVPAVGGPVATETKPEKTPHKAAEKGTEKLLDKPAQKAETKPAKPEPKAEAKTGTKIEQARAQAILEGTEQYVVQLGAFADPANARKIREKVKAEGYNSFTEVLSTSDGSKTRVRAGPFDSREAAEKARDKLKRIGLDGVVAGKS